MSRSKWVQVFTLLVVMTAVVASGIALGADWYVAPNGNSGNAGTSWDAPIDMATAVGKAAGDTFYLKAGLYSQTSQIVAKSDQTWMGGYPASATGTDTSGRDASANPTILDFYNGGSPVANSVAFSNVQNVTMDGVVIQRGTRGVVCESGATVEMIDCIVRDCETNAGQAAGMYVRYADTVMTLRRCKFQANVNRVSSGLRAGAIGISDQASVVIYDSEFVGNLCYVNTGSYGSGAAIGVVAYGTNQGSVKCYNSLFAGNGNMVDGRGGAVILTQSDGGSAFVNCIFAGNFSKDPGNQGIGAAIFAYYAKVDVVNCTFYGTEGHSVIHGSGANTECRFVNNIIAENRTNGDDSFGWYDYSDTTNNLFYNADPAGNVRIERDPKFEAAIAGTWSADPMYSGDGTSWTLLTDATASFTPGALEGLFINPSTSATPYAIVTSNTATQIMIAGGLPAVTGAPYAINSFKTTPGSAAVDKGLDTFTSVFFPSEPLAFRSTDINGNARGQDGNGYAQTDENDLGAYEIAAGASQAADLYVKPTATGAADGSSWANACDWAYADANALSGDMIWVAEGTHVASEIQPYTGQTWLGGFPATGDPDMSDRDPWSNVTTIDGQGSVRLFYLLKDREIVDLTLDGLRLYNGYTASGAAGIRFYPTQSQYITVRNCTFERLSSGNGGAAINAYSSPTRVPHGAIVENCVFTQNTAPRSTCIQLVGDYGGKEFVFDNCLFTSNSVTGSHIFGADHGSFALRNSVIALNTSVTTGSDTVYLGDMTYLEATNNIFVDNTAPGNGSYALWTGAAERVIGGNVYYGNSDTTNNPAPGDIVGLDPLFVSYTPADLSTMDFNLTAASPAIDIGMVNGLTEDFAGNPRPVRANPDRVLVYPDAGAFEFQGTAAASHVWHVKATATGAADGSSWADACDFDYAIANAGENEDIWLAAGTHTLASEFNGAWRLNIFGGFPATGDPGIADRDIANNVSIIDGEDVLRTTALLVFGSGDDQSRIDGVTIQGGNNDRDTLTGSRRGGGIYINYCDVQITSCVIQDNLVDAAWGYGGGGVSILGVDADVLIANTWLRRNSTEDPADAYAGNDGGASIHVDDRANVTIRDCYITDNLGSRGNIHVRDLGTALVQNTVLAFNTAESAGSGVWLRNGGECKMVNCTLYGNQGRVIYSYSGTANTFVGINSIFAANSHAILANVSSDSNYSVGNCLFDANTYTGDMVTGTVTDLGGNLASADYPFGAGGTWTFVGLADPDAYNFYPAALSAAIDHASSTSDSDIPTVDADGNARDVDTPLVGGDGAGNAYDIGAFERLDTTVPSVAGIYVDDDAAPGGDGTKAAPINSIASGISYASTETPPAPWAGAPSTVYVAGGTYNEVLNMKSGITVRGGYSADFNSRDVAATPSIVDGQRVSRSTGVVNFDSADVDARIDGFTITGGRNNNNNGGGVRVDAATNAMVTSCTITANRAKGGYYTGGGGIGVQGTGASLLVDGCKITSNSTYYVDSRWTYQYPGTLGGGVGLLNNTRTQINNSIISDNMSCGGAGIGLNSAKVGLDNTIVANNHELNPSWWHGAGMFMLNRYDTSDASVTTITNCTFYGNDGVDGASANAIRCFTYEATAPVTVAMANTIIAGHGGTGLEVQTYGVVGLGANLFDDNGDDVSLHSSNVVLADLGNNILKGTDLTGGDADVFTNPLFVDADNMNFQLGRGSAAIDKGISSLLGYAASPTDIAGNARDFDVPSIGGDGAGNAYDIGAYEQSAVSSNDGTIYVNDDAAAGGNGSLATPYQSLDEGIAAKNPEWPGDVRVAGGTYAELINVIPSAVVRGAYAEDFSGRDLKLTPSMIDGSRETTTHTRALVRFYSGDTGARLDGFTIQNNRNAFGDWMGGGIAAVGHDAMITTCLVQNNYCLNGNVRGGAGIFASGSSADVSILNCEFFNNVSQDEDPTHGNDGGGGVMAYSSANVIVGDTLITSCRAGRGGGIYVRASATAYVYNTVVAQCESGDAGGGFWMRDRAEALIVNCTFDRNRRLTGTSTSWNDGFYMWGSTSSQPAVATVVNCIFSNHTGRAMTTAVSGESSWHTVRVYNSLFHENGDDLYGPVALSSNNISTDANLGGTAGTDTNPNFMVVPGQDYQYIITPGSVAIDAGLTTDVVPAADFLGNARDSSPDIGATELTTYPPEIIEQPQSIVVDPGDTGAISVVAFGSALLEYQWEFNDGSGWVNVGGSSYQYTLNPAAETDEGSYRVTVTNGYGSVTSDECMVTVNDLPVITVEPVSVHTTPGSSASFSVTVTGTAPMTFQWQKDGALADIDSDHVVTSTDTGSTYLFTDVQPDDPGVYRVQVTNSAGMARSAYVVLSIDGPIQVLRQPTTQTTTFGADATFTIFVSGSQPMTYAWTRNGLPLSDGGNVSGATTNELTIDPVDWADAMGVGYQVTVTNAFPGSGVSPIVGIRLLPTGVSPWWEMMK